MLAIPEGCRPCAFKTSPTVLRACFAGGGFIVNGDEAEARQLDERQGYQQRRVVIGGDPVRILLAATQTAMDEYLLAVAAGDATDRLHQRMADGSTVAGPLQVDVP